MQSFACDRWGCGTDLSEAAALGKGGLAEVVFADALKLWEASLTHHSCRHCGTDVSEAAAVGKGGLAEVVFADDLKLWEGSLTHHNCRHWILADACKT